MKCKPLCHWFDNQRFFFKEDQYTIIFSVKVAMWCKHMQGRDQSQLSMHITVVMSSLLFSFLNGK